MILREDGSETLLISVDVPATIRRYVWELGRRADGAEVSVEPHGTGSGGQGSI